MKSSIVLRLLPFALGAGISASALAKADGSYQLARFEPALASIERSLTSSTDEDEIVEALLDSNRMDAFNLQALSKLYEAEDKTFKDLRSDFKGLEDAIGQYDKWATILKKALKEGAPTSKISKLKAKKGEAKKTFVAWLKDKKWLTSNPDKSHLAKIRKTLAKYDWQKPKKDRDYLLDQLQEQLKKIQKTNFDMSVLEEGNGLHELRRQLRWYAIESRVVNGLVQFRPDDNDCPVKQFADLVNNNIASDKYSSLPASDSEENPCFISHCLHLEIVNEVAVLGDLKDQAEAHNNIDEDGSDVVPAELQPAAKEAYARIRDSGVLDALRDQLKACQK